MPRSAASASSAVRPRRPLLIGLVIALVLALGTALVGIGDLTATNAAAATAQRGEADRIIRAWSSPAQTRSQAQSKPASADTVPAGAIGLLTVPAFGSDYVRVISAGTSSSVLDTGAVGHYAGTAMPGGIGNMALAGHREADGAALFRITELRDGDRIVVETRTRTYVYRVVGSRQIDPSAVGAIAPVPWHPDATPTKRLITLQSCTPPLIDTWRYVVWGELASSTARR